MNATVDDSDPSGVMITIQITHRDAALLSYAAGDVATAIKSAIKSQCESASSIALRRAQVDPFNKADVDSLVDTQLKTRK